MRRFWNALPWQSCGGESLHPKFGDRCVFAWLWFSCGFIDQMFYILAAVFLLNHKEPRHAEAQSSRR